MRDNITIIVMIDWIVVAFYYILRLIIQLSNYALNFVICYIPPILVYFSIKETTSTLLSIIIVLLVFAISLLIGFKIFYPFWDRVENLATKIDKSIVTIFKKRYPQITLLDNKKEDV
jgi:hypothetical protein